MLFRSDVSPADWITHSEDNWVDLALYGPSGFDAYARMRYMPDPEFDGQKMRDAAGCQPAHADGDAGALVARLCAALSLETLTPHDCYFAVWAGYSHVVSPIPGGARMHIPNRDYHLYRGTLAESELWATRTVASAPEFDNPPAFVWPADHAWCIAADTDPHWCGIGASSAAIAHLIARDDIDVVPAEHGRGGPFYRS